MRVACSNGKVGTLRESDSGYPLARAVVPAADVAHVPLGRGPHPSVTAYRLCKKKKRKNVEQQGVIQVV